jgi:hypothetical protein
VPEERENEWAAMDRTQVFAAYGASLSPAGEDATEAAAAGGDPRKGNYDLNGFVQNHTRTSARSGHTFGGWMLAFQRHHTTHTHTHTRHTRHTHDTHDTRTHARTRHSIPQRGMLTCTVG